jgi:hypothetical protein
MKKTDILRVNEQYFGAEQGKSKKINWSFINTKQKIQ